MTEAVGAALTTEEETANARRRALFAKTPAELTKLLKKAGAPVEEGRAKAWYVNRIMECEAKAKVEAPVESGEAEEVETVKPLTEEDIDRKLAPYGQMIKRLEDTVATLVASNASMAVTLASLVDKDKVIEGKIDSLGKIDDLTHPVIPSMVAS